MPDEQGLSPGVRDKKACEERLRALAGPGEEVVAVGTAEELRELKRDLGSGGGWTFMVLTDRRVLYAQWGSPQSNHDELQLDSITRWAHGTQYNVYAVMLEHPPRTRVERVPAHNLLWFRWGNARRPVTRTQTIFRFSRKDTEVAKALRWSLEHRQLPVTVLEFHEASREERTLGTQVELRAKKW